MQEGSVANGIGWLVLLVLLVGVLLWFVPFVAFWAINQLFGYRIEMSFLNVVAFWTLTQVMHSRIWSFDLSKAGK